MLCPPHITLTSSSRLPAGPSSRCAGAHRRWLLGLLVLQSMSSVVLEHYEQLIKDHLVVTLFLTMLVGAGGNAGNQSAIKVIRGLVSSQLLSTSWRRES